MKSCYFKSEILCLLGFWMCCTSSQLISQCQNTTLFPTAFVTAGNYNELVVISETQMTGQYAVIENLQPGKQYTIASTGLNDYITIRDYYISANVVAHGVSPLSFVVLANTPNKITVHFNLQLPPCGAENSIRSTTIQCIDCGPAPVSLGIGKNNPDAILDVNGEIKLAGIRTPASAGAIQWNSVTKDFEGFDGSNWRSFTKPNGQWGALVNKLSNESQKIRGDSTQATDGCGISVSVDGKFAAVGCYLDSINGNEKQGSVYIFKKSGTTWVQHAKIYAADGTTFDEFGYSVSLDGDMLAVGAFNASIVGTNLPYGAVYIYKRVGNNWIQQAKLYDSMGGPFEDFGKKVLLKDGVMFIGCPSCKVSNNVHQGKVWIFRNNGSTWSFETELTSSDASLFGTSISFSGNSLAIGAPQTFDGPANPTGACYLYEKLGQSWNFVKKISQPNLPLLSNLGQSVALYQNWLAVGVPDNNAGEVLLYERTSNDWVYHSKLIADSMDDNFKFGYEVSMLNQILVVGAPGFDDKSGQAYIYKGNASGWKFDTLLRSKERFVYDRFGISLQASDESIIIGSVFTPTSIGRGKYFTYIFNKN